MIQSRRRHDVAAVTRQSLLMLGISGIDRLSLVEIAAHIEHNPKVLVLAVRNDSVFATLRQHNISASQVGDRIESFRYLNVRVRELLYRAALLGQSIDAHALDAE
jgi:hypothetical protein